MKFTDAQVRNLKPRKKRYTVLGHKCLGVRVTPSGTRTWIFMYRRQGRQRMMTLGQYPDLSVAQAHAAHARALEALEQGHDPATQAVAQNAAERRAPTLAALADEYLEKWAQPRKRSWKEDQRLIERNVLPMLGHRRAKDIKRRDIILLLDRLVERGAPVTANRTLAVVRKLFNFAVSRDLLENSPCWQVKPPALERQRERVLSESEIRVFWQGLDHACMSKGTRIALRLVLVTAQRSGELARATWEEVDLDAGWWVIPGERTKNKLTHRVPISHLARHLFLQAKLLSRGSPWVFPSPLRQGPVTPNSLSRALQENRQHFPIPHFVPHDLRRTAASHLTGKGTPRLVVQKILNHAEAGVTAVYDRHSYDAEKKQALETWGQNLTRILRNPAEHIASKSH